VVLIRGTTLRSETSIAELIKSPRSYAFPKPLSLELFLDIGLQLAWRIEYRHVRDGGENAAGCGQENQDEQLYRTFPPRA
jgi:hypothetical protein